ncbi:DUF551 domain-containing protein [Enterobacter cloacae]|uniref:DUF551 domain-containing protein n=2 Tax=Enterobacter cloacae TaxID=550 RepID=A0A0H3CRI4_ENTCC|nr:DUF551 domain-containing protein [Enterobacter cloacae]ADF63137.1 hypothetical protein ECL_03603 [Enterobacter cloacae subsp. cloacae ATCC 13047]KGB11956.1 hypothetical protein DR74_3645 [Enterobacter cloacae]OOC90504.1 hypothetical protein BWP06_07425 [Enterobacter cloacae]QLA63889.1 DUF551 domain-containing protein [Enterobacter cloacae]QWZ87607.1 DUF551 domain-containing protein [Enterobacter cloacae]
MSTITKERLTELSRRENVGAILGEEIAELARIALASLEAEPVCVIDQSNLDYLKSGSDADVWPASRTEMGDVLLYRTAPPAPVSVPAAMEMDDDFDSAFEHGKAVGWNAYRAAMLQSFGNSEQLNSPVIQDAWVACSERMPIENDIVLVVDDGYFVCEAQYREGDFFSAARGKGEFFETTCRDVELWMPLPAATQQEVK